MTRRRTLITAVLANLLLAACGGDSPTQSSAGRVLWRVEGRGSESTPSEDSATVFFSTRDHELLALDKTSGAVRWRRSITRTSLFPYGIHTVVAGDIAVLGHLDVFGFERGSGNPAWTFSAPDGDEAAITTLATDGATIFTASSANRVYAIDARTGSQQWLTRLPDAGQTSPFHPAYHDGSVFVGIARYGFPTTTSLVSLDAATGAIRWVRDFVDADPNTFAASQGNAVFHGPHVITVAEGGRIYALDRATGELRWSAGRVHPQPFYVDRRPLAVSGDVVVAASTTGTIVGLSAETGAERWRRTDPAAAISFADITADGPDVFVTGESGELFVIEAATGAIRWRSVAGAGQGRFASAPVADSDRLFIAGPTGFFALRRD